MNHQLSLVLLLLIIAYVTSFSPIIVRRRQNLLYSNDFARNNDPMMMKNDNNDDETETLRKKTAAELDERKEVSDSMRSRLLQEIRDGGGDPNFSKGAVAGNPILIISFVVAALAVASYAIGAI